MEQELEIYRQASSLKSRGEYGKARELFSRITADFNDKNLKSGAFFHLGEMAWLENEKENAKKYFINCLTLNPEHKRAESLLNEIGLSHLEKIKLERDQLKSRLDELEPRLEKYPPGHYFSAIPDRRELKERERQIFDIIPGELPGINLEKQKQKELLQEFTQYYKELPFTPQKAANLRYYYDNPAYSYADAIFLFCMIRHFKPARIVEVGSGYSSCVILDSNELFFNHAISCIFIEPYPSLLEELIKDDDIKRIKIIPRRLQEVEPVIFRSLQRGDILFIDSTHVSKTGSDVNVIFSEILPALNKGVLIHFHDIFYPFEYPRKWVYDGIAWNEAYLLRAFLQFNNQFEIVLFNTYLEHFHEDFFTREMPLCLKNRGGSIWIRRK